MKPRILPLLLGLALAGCASNPYYDPARAHHRPDGFHNLYQPDRHLNREALKWQWQRLLEGFPPPPPRDPIPVVAPDLAFLRANTMQPTITWIGHATLLVQLGGLNILTDPVFSQRAFPVQFMGPKRHQPPGIPLAQLPHIDAVILSHDHYDHLDLASVRALYAQTGGPPRLLAPLGIHDWLARHVTHGDRTQLRGLDWWDQETVGRVRFQLLPVQHWCARGLLDRNRRLWGGWGLEADGLRLFFGGDFGLSPDLDTIGERTGGFDLALLPIGAYAPRWMMHPAHVDPEGAVEARRRLRARQAVAMHWGTFELSDEPLDEPPRALATARRKAGLAAEDFFTLAIGETHARNATGWGPVATGNARITP